MCKEVSKGGCIVGITDESDLWSIPSIWVHIQTKFHEDWFRLSGNVNSITLTIRGTAMLVFLMGRVYDVYTIYMTHAKFQGFK
jgi:hypothetical protein